MTSSSTLDDIVPWAGAALMLIENQIASSLADSSIRTLEERPPWEPEAGVSFILRDLVAHPGEAGGKAQAKA